MASGIESVKDKRGVAVLVGEFGDPDVMRGEMVDEREPVGEEVLVRVKAIGINPVETYIRGGKYPVLPSLPFVPGHDCAGTIVGVGEGVKGLKVGENVLVRRTENGAYREFSLALETNCVALRGAVSESLGLDSGVEGFGRAVSLATPYFTAYRALFQRAKLEAGDWLLVHGATGGVGLAAVQLGRRHGCRVIGTAGSSEGMRLVLANGAEASINHRDGTYMLADESVETPEGEDLETRRVQAVMKLTHSTGVHVVLENLADQSLRVAMKSLARGGTVAIVGSRGDIEITPRDLMAREAAVLGVAMAHATPTQNAQAQASILQGVAEKSLLPTIGYAFKATPQTLQQAARDSHDEVLTHARTGGTARGKVVILIE